MNTLDSSGGEVYGDVSNITDSPKTNKSNLEVDQNSGALLYKYPIQVPPGRNGLQPDLALSYNSQDLKYDSEFGYGWGITIPYIERLLKKGIDKAYTENYFTSSLSGELEDVSLSDGHHGTYGAKVDSGDFLKYEFNTSNYWLVTDKKGTVYKFGYNASARQNDPSDSSHVFKWMLEEVRDTNNNYIKYEYYKDNGQIYPSAIKYTGYNTTDGIFEIDFLRESRSNDYVSYKEGFEATTGYRIYEIQAKVSGTWARKYELDYTASSENDWQELLTSITESGNDGSQTISLPVTTFTYQTNGGYVFYTQDQNVDFPTKAYNAMWNGHASNGTFSTDANGDGLSDIVQYKVGYTNCQYSLSRSFLSNGNGWDESSEWTSFNLAKEQYCHSNGDFSVYLRPAIFIDINGDGLSDFVKSGIRLNNSANQDYVSISWNIPLSLTDANGYGIQDYVHLGDFNGDGLVDYFAKYYINGNWHMDIMPNLGNGWYVDNTWSFPSYLSDGIIYNHGIKFADINGDSLDDILVSQNDDQYGTIRKVYLNTGAKSWAETTDFTISSSLVFFIRHTNPDQNMVMPIEFNDLNKDGLTDVIYDESVYINDGSTFIDTTDITSFYSPYFGQISGRNFMEINGDGMPDYSISSKSGIDESYWVGSQYENSEDLSSISKSVYINQKKPSGLLIGVENSKGGSMEVTYKGSGEYKGSNDNLLNPHLPVIVQTVSQITYNDGLNNSWSENYQYANGEYYFSDYLNRKLAGFGLVTKTDAGGNVTKSYFHQGNTTDSSHGEYSDDVSKIGKVYRAEVYDDSDNLYSKSINKWENYDLGNDRDFVKLTQTISFSYDGNTSHKDKAETYTYDNATGNLTQKVTWGEVTGSDNGTYTDTGTDKFTTDIDYAATTGSAVIGLPSQETTEDQSSNKVKETKYYYDSLTLGNVDKGNLTKQEMWKSGTSYIDVEKTYNSYGIVTQEKDPRDKTTDYTYDSYNLYPATVTNALDLDTDYEYDYSSGKPTQVTDPNGRVFQTVYDALDRVKQEKQPDLTTPSTLVVKTEYTYTDNTVPSKVQQTNNLDSSTSFDIYTYLDGFGRKIQERKEAEASNTFSVKDFAYNDLGLVDRESLPYFSTGTSRTTATTDNSLYTSYTYDPLQRVATSTNAVGTTTNTYDDWKLTITDAESNVKDLYKDAYDNLVQVDEHNDSSTYTTTYGYNGLGNLLNITDSQDNVRNFTYDGLGRRLTAEDLHDPEDEYFGEWTYGYDDSGNLTSRTDPNSQTVNWTYDDLNRVLTEDYTGQSGTEVAYVYDTGTDGIGRLYTATTPDVVTTHTYNPLGGVKTENKYIDSTNYLTEFAYDRQGNQTLITYPSEDEVKYEYNTAGLLEKIQNKPAGEQSFTDLVSDYDYSPLEQVTYQEDANGVKTFNTYDEQKLYRLKEKITASPDEGDYGEGMFNMAMAVPSAGVIQSGSEESIAPATTGILSALGVTADSPLTSAGVIQSDSVESIAPATTGILSALGVTADSPLTPLINSVTMATESLGLVKDPQIEPLPVKPGEKVQRDFLGRPVDYSNYPKDTTVYIKTDPNAKSQELPKEAIEAYDKAAAKPQPEPELKTLLPQEAVDYYNSQAQTSPGDGSMMLLESVNPPNPSTNLQTENLWKSDNIIYNSGFEDGFAYWQWQNKQGDTHTEDCTVSYSGSCSEKVTIATSGNFWETQVYQVLRLDENINYKLRFKAKASTAITFSLEAVQNHTPFNDLGLWKGDLSIGTDWQEYEYTFTALASDQDARVTFYLGANAADYWFDDIELIPDALNMLKNTSFENNLDNWEFYDYNSTSENTRDCAEASDGDCNNKVENMQSGEWWQVSLNQPISVVADQTYILTFYAHSNYDTRIAKVAIAKNYSPWTDLTAIAEFHTNWNGGFAKYQIELTPNATESNARLIFYLGDDQGWIKLDSLRLWPQQATKVSDSTPEFSAIYDDPDSGDYATDYQIQLIKYDGNWSNPIWDSGKTSFNSNVLEGNRTEDIIYDGDALPLDGMKYKWRIKLWDESDNEGVWTNGEDFFIMNGKRIQDLSYTYDDVGNITQIIDESETNTKKAANYAYDDLYRLTLATITDSATDEDYTQTYTYDSLGNFTDRSDVGDYDYDGNTGTSYANPHAVTSVQNDAVAINYDHNGNLTSEILSQYQWTIFEAEWDYNNRMISSGGWSAETVYSYDHSGQRIVKDTGDEYSGITTIYANKYYNERTNKETSELTKTLNIYDNKGNLVATGEEVGETSNIYYVNGDHLGSSSVMTTDTGDMEQVVDYFPYGNMRFNEQRVQNESYDQKEKFSGKIFDQDAAGLSYFGTRYYSGEAGKFISEDPVFLAVGDNENIKRLARIELQQYLSNPQIMNSYSYSYNNPLIYKDGDGNFAFLIPIAAYAVATAPVWVPAVITWSAATTLAISTPLVGGQIYSYAKGDNATGNQMGDVAMGVMGIEAGVAGGIMSIDKMLSSSYNKPANRTKSNSKSAPLFSSHAQMRMEQRGISIDQVKNVMENNKPFNYYHENNWKTGYYDQSSKVFVAQANESGQVITVINDVSPQYISNLQSLKP